MPSIEQVRKFGKLWVTQWSEFPHSLSQLAYWRFEIYLYDGLRYIIENSEDEDGKIKSLIKEFPKY